jgi:hypothetical protein
MPDYRKPPLHQRNRADAAPPSTDSIPFSIETTTMRLKSLKLRRSESTDRDRQQEHTPVSRESVHTSESPGGPSGRVRHDERGVAVWDWAVATGEFATLSATNVMKKLDVGELSIDETQRAIKRMQPVGRDQGGGGDPYNTRGAGQRVGEAAKRQGVTGSADRPRDASVLDQLTGKKK